MTQIISFSYASIFGKERNVDNLSDEIIGNLIGELISPSKPIFALLVEAKRDLGISCNMLSKAKFLVGKEGMFTPIATLLSICSFSRLATYFFNMVMLVLDALYVCKVPLLLSDEKKQKHQTVRI